VSPREKRLRQRIDTLTSRANRWEGRARFLEEMFRPSRRKVSACVYCGAGTRVQELTCDDHADLLQLDPAYRGA
jgi:hypothetical protein